MGLLDGKVAVVTNSGTEVGQAIALLMADEGARLVVHDSETLAQEIRERGSEAVAFMVPVSSWEGSHDLVQTAVEHFGRLDMLVNNADHTTGIRDRLLSDMSKEEWEGVAKAQLKASFLCARAAAPQMRSQRQGRLIHFALPEALIGGTGRTHQGAAQMAVVGLSRNAAIELERYHVTSNCIVPCDGPGGGPEPTDVAPLAVFLGSDAAEGISGQIFGVRAKEIFLFSQPRIQRSIHNSRGWTPERLSAIFETTMGPHFTPLESSDAYFSWDLDL